MKSNQKFEKIKNLTITMLLEFKATLLGDLKKKKLKKKRKKLSN
jgi:hypothetical protein